MALQAQYGQYFFDDLLSEGIADAWLTLPLMLPATYKLAQGLQHDADE